MPASPQPFTVAVPNDVLNDLQSRLKLARFPDELDGAGRAYGSPLGNTQRLVARWRDGYDWRRREAEINKLPQFTLPIDVDGFGTLDIHFVHQRSAVEGAIPLLFSHGCEFLDGVAQASHHGLRQETQGRDTSWKWKRSFHCSPRRRQSTRVFMWSHRACRAMGSPRHQASLASACRSTLRSATSSCWHSDTTSTVSPVAAPVGADQSHRVTRSHARRRLGQLCTSLPPSCARSV
jgi:hypothetical protein